MKITIIVIVILGLLAFGALNYHVILLDDSVKILKKADLTLEDTYVDARGMKKYKLIVNPALVEAGIKDILKKEGISVDR